MSFFFFYFDFPFEEVELSPATVTRLRAEAALDSDLGQSCQIKLLIIIKSPELL